MSPLPVHCKCLMFLRRKILVALRRIARQPLIPFYSEALDCRLRLYKLLVMLMQVEEAKQELQEVVEFLRNPEKFRRLGGKMPQGTHIVFLGGFAAAIKQ